MRNNTFKKLKFLDYAKAYKDLEGFCVQHTNLVLFGEFGNASFPSISDLDVFICLKEHNFKEDYKKIISFIESDEIRKYVFFHDPLIISESLLKYFNQFHTAYNLNFSFNKKGNLIEKRDLQETKLLNNIWITFLISIGPDVLIYPQYSNRDKLLVLKNICQSIVNMDETSEALLYSDQIRSLFIKGEISSNEINEVFKSKLVELYKQSENLQLENKIDFGKNKYQIERNKLIVNGNHNSFSLKDGNITINLNKNVFNLFSQFYYKTSANPLVQNYIDNAIIVNKLCYSLDTAYPFISPFGFQFYRNDFKFCIKKKFLSLVYTYS